MSNIPTNMYNHTIKHDVFTRIERLDAEIATVKELLKEATDIDDILGMTTYKSRLNVLDTERADQVLKTIMRNNQYSL